MGQRKRGRKGRVLLATNQPGDDYALDYGARLAEALEAELDHWMIVETVDELKDQIPALAREEASWKDREPEVKAELRKGLAVEMLSRLNPREYRLVVLRFRGRRGLKKVFPRSEILAVLRHAPLSFLVHLGGRRRFPQKVLYCTGGSPFAQQAVEFGALLLSPLGVESTILHVAETRPEFVLGEAGGAGGLDPRIRRAITRAQRTLTRAGSAAEEKVRFGKVTDQILAEAVAGRYDLIVVGSHGMGGIRHLIIGSVPEELVKSSRVPVLIVRAKKAGTRWGRLHGGRG